MNLKEDSHQKQVEEEEEKSDKKDKKEEEKEEKVNLWCYSVPERPLHRTVYKYTSTQYSSLFLKHKSLNIDGGTLWNWETDQRGRAGVSWGGCVTFKTGITLGQHLTQASIKRFDKITDKALISISE